MVHCIMLYNPVLLFSMILNTNRYLKEVNKRYAYRPFKAYGDKMTGT
jgi:hypothetical protein